MQGPPTATQHAQDPEPSAKMTDKDQPKDQPMASRQAQSAEPSEKAIPMDEEQRRVVYRYLIARVDLRKADLPPLSDLEYQMKHGFDRLTGGVVVNRNATQPITADDQDPAFYAAVVNGHAEAINITSLDLEQTRNFVLHNQGSLPPPFGRSDSDVTGPTDDMPDVGHQLTSRLDPGMAAKKAQWGSYPPDISDAAAG